jgi:hypothetical protein
MGSSYTMEGLVGVFFSIQRFLCPKNIQYEEEKGYGDV